MLTELDRHVNGYSYNDLKIPFSTAFKDTITKRIQELRPVFRAANWNRQVSDFVFGSRFNEDARVLLGILTGIIRLYPDWSSMNMLDMENVERHHIDLWVNDSLRDCAEADHWYLYEKQYE
jgi:hypothetical protein